MDSNKVTEGPDQYLAGARVCNVGDTAATNVTATFFNDGGNSFISVLGASTLSIPLLPAGSTSHPPGNTGPTPGNCYDFYFNLKVARNTSAYSTLNTPGSRQKFRIQATATNSGTVSTPINRELYVEKLVSQARNTVKSITGPSTVYQGQTVQYTVNAATAPGGYEQLSVLPLLPVFFQVISASSTYSTPAGATNNSVYADACGWENDPSSTFYHNNGACNNPAITDTYTGDKAGDNITTVYTIKVLSTGSGALSNIIYDFSGSSYHYNADVGTGINNFAVTALPPQADLSTTKTDGQSIAVTGTQISYTITARNNGPSDITGAIVSDTVPNTITNVTWACVASVGSSCGAVNGTGNTINTTANLLNGGTATYTVTGSISPSATGTLSNTATVAAPAGTTDPNAGNNSSTDENTLTANADLSITKTDNQTTATSGSQIQYIIVAKNNGPSTATGAIVTDTVPNTITNITWACVASVGSSCGAANGTGNTINTTANLLNGGTATYTVTGSISPSATSSLRNTATVAAPTGTTDPNTANNTGIDENTLTSSADVITTKVGPNSVVAGGSIVYTITTTNNGPSTATNVVIQDTLPTGVTFNSASDNGTVSNGVVTWPTIASLSPQTSVTRTVTVTAPVSGGPLLNKASSTATTTDPTPANNNGTQSASQVSTSITPSADLSLTKTANSTNLGVGQSVTFTVTVRNTGPSSATGVTVTDLLPSGLTLGLAMPSQGTYNSATGLWTVGNLASGANATLQVTAIITRSTPVTNTAQVTASNQPDPDSTPGNSVVGEDDQASVTLGSSNPQLLLVKRVTAIIPSNGANTTSFVDDPGTTNDNASNWPSGYLKGAIDGGATRPGDEVEYTIYFLSNGGRTAQSVNVCDLVPTNTTFSPNAFASGSGIAKAFGSATATNLTNTGTDADGGQFISSGGTLPSSVNCSASNTNGTVIISLGDVPNSTGPGTPSTSYGFIRFRARVN
ncbi:DUF11 domain-containing protein [Leptolyngbya sp. FACHB-261]|uniref:DUF7507 domain-containing protein n=1 Tax=Leptolyngbya sp. FACHB-261 TaxID=2692806 RepID=UPI001681D315|nr:DUF11 domain-containing protein [Leptolyngbya sp. FACHB-261]MBD2101034.1 DUF11 domain-containing protein [Leptolyngbya sp. FACHB-261]